MCGRYYINDETAREIEKVVRQVNEKLLRENRDVYPSAKAPVIIAQPKSEKRYHSGKAVAGPLNASNYQAANESNLAVAEYTWGFRHFNNKNKVIFNARTESVLEKKMFKESTLKRRCIIPASGFYEWNELKDKYFFKSKDDKILLFAGIYDDDRFVILTTGANDSIKDIHNRMPLILEPKEIEDWIYNDKALEQLLQKKPRELKREITGQISLFDLD